MQVINNENLTVCAQLVVSRSVEQVRSEIIAQSPSEPSAVRLLPCTICRICLCTGFACSLGSRGCFCSCAAPAPSPPLLFPLPCFILCFSLPLSLCPSLSLVILLASFSVADKTEEHARKCMLVLWHSLMHDLNLKTLRRMRYLMA